MRICLKSSLHQSSASDDQNWLQSVKNSVFPRRNFQRTWKFPLWDEICFFGNSKSQKVFIFRGSQRRKMQKQEQKSRDYSNKTGAVVVRYFDKGGLMWPRSKFHVKLWSKFHLQVEIFNFFGNFEGKKQCFWPIEVIFDRPRLRIGAANSGGKSAFLASNSRL